MSDNEIALGNQLFADFMEWEQDEKGFWIGDKGVSYSKLTFHKSWDSLIPVWSKFRNIFIDSDKKDTQLEAWIDSLSYYLITSDTPIRFYERLIYAVRWYISNLPIKNTTKKITNEKEKHIP